MCDKIPCKYSVLISKKLKDQKDWVKCQFYKSLLASITNLCMPIVEVE